VGVGVGDLRVPSPSKEGPAVGTIPSPPCHDGDRERDTGPTVGSPFSLPVPNEGEAVGVTTGDTDTGAVVGFSPPPIEEGLCVSHPCVDGLGPVDTSSTVGLPLLDWPSVDETTVGL
jgi:hypothetical protein